MRLAVFDIETHDLKPEFGPLLCASVYDVAADEMRTFRIDDYKKRRKARSYNDDRRMLMDLRDHLETFHMTAGWYSKGFDLTHIRSRLVLQGERPLRRHLHLDANWYFRGWRGLRPMSSKLKHVSKFFGFEDKPDVAPEVWMAAKQGDPDAMEVVVERCEADTRITAAITLKAIELELVKSIQAY